MKAVVYRLFLLKNLKLLKMQSLRHNLGICFFFFHEKSCFLLEIFSLTIWNHPIYFGTCDRPWWERCVIALTRVRTRHIKNTLAVCHTTKILYVFRHLLMIHPFPTRINWCLSIFNFYSFIWLLLVFSVPVIC